VFTYQFHHTGEKSLIRQRCQAENNRPLHRDGGNLAAVLLRLKRTSPRSYTRIVETIRQVVPFFADFVLEPENGTLQLRWNEIGSENLFGAHQASDGTLRLIALVTLLSQPNQEIPDLILIDEPELGLYPQALNVIAGLLKAVSVHKQIIVATQSPSLLNSFEPDDVIVVERQGRESIFRRLDPAPLSDWLNDYSLADLWEKNVLGGGVYR